MMPNTHNLKQLSPDQEQERIKVLKRYHILDTPQEESFDRLTLLATILFDVPIAMITIIDSEKIWFKSKHGIEGVNEIPIEPGLCATAIQSSDLYLIEDALADPRSAQNSLVTGDLGVRFYAAVPLKTKEGFNLGTFSIVDKKKRKFKKKDEEIFLKFTELVIDLIELKASEKNNQNLKEELLENVAHNLKNPLTIITLHSEILKMEKDNPKEIEEMCDQIKNSSQKMTQIIDDMLLSAKHERGKMNLTLSKINLNDLLKEVLLENQVLAIKKNTQYKIDIQQEIILQADKLKIKEILDNLINNAIKYSPANKNIFITLHVQRGSAIINIRDEGLGLTEHDKSRIFQRFSKLSAKPTAGESSTGLGLSIVKALVEAHGGNVYAESEGKNKGSTFTIELPI